MNNELLEPISILIETEEHTMNHIFRIGLIVACILTFQYSEAKIFDHIKQLENKGSHHVMKNIDFIYLINLDERPEKYRHCIETLHPHGIYPYRFSAVNGWLLSIEQINDVAVKYIPGMKGVQYGNTYFLDKNGAIKHSHETTNVPGKPYFAFGVARGTIGIVLSHLSILKDAYDSGYETIWIMEDDIELIQDPYLVSDIIEELDTAVGKNGWDILFTDRDTKNQKGEYVPCYGYAQRLNYQPIDPTKFSKRTQINNNFIEVGARYGAYSIIVRRAGIKKILDFYSEYQIFLPYDIDIFMIDGIRLFTVTNDIVSTLPKALSDNGVPWYQYR